MVFHIIRLRLKLTLREICTSRNLLTTCHKVRNIEKVDGVPVAEYECTALRIHPLTEQTCMTDKTPWLFEDTSSFLDTMTVAIGFVAVSFEVVESLSFLTDSCLVSGSHLLDQVSAVVEQVARQKEASQ